MQISDLIILCLLLGCLASYVPVFLSLFFTAAFGFMFFLLKCVKDVIFVYGFFFYSGFFLFEELRSFLVFSFSDARWFLLQ